MMIYLVPRIKSSDVRIYFVSEAAIKNEEIPQTKPQAIPTASREMLAKIARVTSLLPPRDGRSRLRTSEVRRKEFANRQK